MPRALATSRSALCSGGRLSEGEIGAPARGQGRSLSGLDGPHGLASPQLPDRLGFGRADSDSVARGPDLCQGELGQTDRQLRLNRHGYLHGPDQLPPGFWPRITVVENTTRTHYSPRFGVAAAPRPGDLRVSGIGRGDCDTGWNKWAGSDTGFALEVTRVRAGLISATGTRSGRGTGRLGARWRRHAPR